MVSVLLVPRGTLCDSSANPRNGFGFLGNETILLVNCSAAFMAVRLRSWGLRSARRHIQGNWFRRHVDVYIELFGSQKSFQILDLSYQGA